MFTDAASLIDTFGGSAQAATKLGRPIGTVAAWKHRKAIPVEAWPDVISLATKEGVKGVTAERLLEIHSGAAP